MILLITLILLRVINSEITEKDITEIYKVSNSFMELVLYISLCTIEISFFFLFIQRIK